MFAHFFDFLLCWGWELRVFIFFVLFIALAILVVLDLIVAG